MKRRQAFTLVELMVSMALIIFIMSILSQAFVAALGVFRNLKGQGDLAEKLRSTMQILQRDLGAYHFEGNKRLSDPTFWNNGPPQQGFFQIWHGPPATPTGTWFGTAPVIPGFTQVFQGPPILGSTAEGADPSLINSFRTINHALAFTVRLAGNGMGDYLSASAAGSGNVWFPPPINTPVVFHLPGNPTPPGPAVGLGIGAIQNFGPPESRYQPILGTAGVSGYNYQWGEVAWFLQPQTPNPSLLANPSTNPQDQTAPDPGTGSTPIPLYTLYRRQRLLVPDNNQVSLATIPPGGVPSSYLINFQEMSCWPNPSNSMIYFNSPVDITVPQRRFGYNPLAVPPTFPPSAFTPISVVSPLSVLSGSDIQLNDVVSFDIRLLPMYPVGTAPLNPADPFVTLFEPPFSTIFNTAPYTYLAPPGTAGMVFDTWSSVTDGMSDYSQWNAAGTPTGPRIPFWTNPALPPPTYQYPGNILGQTIMMPTTGSGPIIKAIQITIRIWDYKTNQTRQVTIVQAM